MLALLCPVTVLPFLLCVVVLCVNACLILLIYAGVSPNLLFDWAMPVLAGQGIAGWVQLDVGVQCWVLVALKECMAALDMPVLHQHALAVLTLCCNLLRSDATSVHLIAPVLGLVTEVSLMNL